MAAALPSPATRDQRAHRVPTLILALATLLALGTLAACDQQRVAKLEEGVSGELEVMKQFGVPLEIHAEADGSRTFEYTRQPEGVANYFITIGPDGKMSALRQVLSRPYFEKVQPGMERAAVRRLLGQPALKQPFPLKQEEVWDWRWQDGQQRKVFRVTFDAAGRVTQAGSVDDPRELYGGGG